MTEYGKIAPPDQYNKELLANVHPDDWVNPEPAPRYNLVVIGAGTAGLVTAAGAAGLGAKVALVERHLLGGDCLNMGCVPSKAIIRSADMVGALREAKQFGINISSDWQVDFAAVMERMRRLRSKISNHDSASKFRDMGIDVYMGQGRFTNSSTVEVAGKVLRFSKAVVATGARAVVLNVPGLVEAGFLTNESVFSLTECPRRLVVFGAGPLGCELAQAFSRLGSDVTIVEMDEHLLPREDRDAAEIIARAFKRDGINVELSTTVQRITRDGDTKVLHLMQNGREHTITADSILLGAGRAPNVEDVGLEAVGVKYDKRIGILVDDHLRTTNKRIFAAGDVCLTHKFTHTADATARIVIQNALFWGRKRLSDLTIPWCTFTHPNIAHVGMYERDAQAQGIEVDTFMRSFSEVDRAITDSEEDGMIKVHVKKGTDRILGATIVTTHAGDMISEITVAMVNKIGLKSIASIIHPYPTKAEAIKQVADAYNQTRLSPFIKKIFARILRWQR